MAGTATPRSAGNVTGAGPGGWAYVALGSNLGDAAWQLRTAAARLAQLGTVMARSSLYATAPVGGPAHQDDYLNAVIALDMPGAEPQRLLQRLLAIEAEMGRVRRARWGPRLIDLDLLALGDVRVGARDAPTPEEQGQERQELLLPHPRLAERAFVLVPLCEIGSIRNEMGRAWVHPLTGLDACSMLAALSGFRRPTAPDDRGVIRTDVRW